MPRRSPEPAPPPVMTWGKASPILVVCGIFDVLRFAFNQFWLFGPLLVATGVGLVVDSYIGWSWAAGVVGAGVGLAAGFFGIGVFIILGTILAFCTALLGWGTIVLLLILMNPRIFSVNASSILWSFCGLVVSALPLIGSVPALSFTMWRLYHHQIAHDKKALASYTAARKARRAQDIAAAQAAVRMRDMEAANDDSPAIHAEAA